MRSHSHLHITELFLWGGGVVVFYPAQTIEYSTKALNPVYAQPDLEAIKSCGAPVNVLILTRLEKCQHMNGTRVFHFYTRWKYNLFKQLKLTSSPSYTSRQFPLHLPVPAQCDLAHSVGFFCCCNKGFENHVCRYFPSSNYWSANRNHLTAPCFWHSREAGWVATQPPQSSCAISFFFHFSPPPLLPTQGRMREMRERESPWLAWQPSSQPPTWLCQSGGKDATTSKLSCFPSFFLLTLSWTQVRIRTNWWGGASILLRNQIDWFSLPDLRYYFAYLSSFLTCKAQ